MAFNDGVKVGPIAYIGAVSVLVTFALVLLLQVLYYQQNNSLQEAEFAAQGPPRELTELTAKQRTALMKRGYVDRERDVVSIGIKRAKELVVTELGELKSPQDVIGPRPPDLGPLKKAETAKAEPDAKQEPQNDGKR